MCKIETANESENIEVLYRVSRSKAFCAVIEANEKDPESYREGRLSELMGQASRAARLGSLTGQLPFDFAQSLASVLARWTAEKSLLQVVLYAGVLVEPGWAHVCTAGDIRVHLLENGESKAVTRDHNQIDDPQPGIEAVASQAPREILLGAPTRSIGPTSGRPPECLDWALSQGSSIEICASPFHRYRDPNSYVGSLADRQSRRAPATDGPEFFIRIFP
jgi:hypothetical protein